jgi:hypothetical protein
MSAMSGRALETTQSPIGAGVLSRVYSSRGVMLTTHLHLELRLRKNAAILLLPIQVFTAHTGTIAFTFTIIRCLRRSEGPVKVQSFMEYICQVFTVISCQPLAQPPNGRTTPCQLSATVYSIYSRLPSISGRRLLHPQSDKHQVAVTRIHHAITKICVKKWFLNRRFFS